jgi:hypothetical protein
VACDPGHWCGISPRREVSLLWRLDSSGLLRSARSSDRLIKTTLVRGAVARITPCPVLDRNTDLSRASVFTKGCIGVQPQEKRTAASEPVSETVRQTEGEAMLKKPACSGNRGRGEDDGGFSALVPIPNIRGRRPTAPFGLGPRVGARVGSHRWPYPPPGSTSMLALGGGAGSIQDAKKNKAGSATGRVRAQSEAGGLDKEFSFRDAAKTSLAAAKTSLAT